MATEPRGIGVYSFKEILQGQSVYFNVLRLKQSFMLWIGTAAKMDVLSIAMKNINTSEVVSSQLFGPPTDVISSAMAQRLAKRTGCQCFVSVNLADVSLVSHAEAAVLAKLETDSTLFYFQ